MSYRNVKIEKSARIAKQSPAIGDHVQYQWQRRKTGPGLVWTGKLLDDGLRLRIFTGKPLI